MSAILGISGLDAAVEFKRRHWPGLSEPEYRICQGHDSAAAIVVDGECVAAAAEERFTRRKHTGAFPANAMRYCLSEAGLRLDDIECIAHCFDYAPYRRLFLLDPVSAMLYREVYSRQSLVSLVQREFPDFPAERIRQVNHHTAHAAGAWLTSGWDDCLVVVADGMGEVHSLSVYAARDGALEPIHQAGARDSLGILYSLVTLHLGFDFNSDEYKIMGLAPYGDPRRFRRFFDRAVLLDEGGALRIPLLKLDRTREGHENYTVARRFLSAELCPERKPDEPVEDVHRDVAAALQECLERALLHVCAHFGSQTQLPRLALTGGVALNCTANGKLLASGLFEDIYVPPAAGDDGAALGAALSQVRPGEARNRRSPVPFFGPACTASDLECALAAFRDRIAVTWFDGLEETCAEVARLIHAGAVIAWHRGRMEFGARALGHRSILADPGRPEMRDRVNAMVKMREAFRPFAPAVTVEQVNLWFHTPPLASFPYMTVTVDVREEHRAALPAITHVNGSARIQTVSAEDNPEFHVLLRAIGKISGKELVLNTSFNVKGQPIVNTPEEAIVTFLNTGIDFLFLENCLVSRRGD
jgi:carbamoyltransferase